MLHIKFVFTNFAMHNYQRWDSAILVRTFAIPQYSEQPKRNCRLKKVAELQLPTFKIWLPQLSTIYGQFSYFIVPFPSSGCFKNQPKIFFELSFPMETKNLPQRDCSTRFLAYQFFFMNWPHLYSWYTLNLRYHSPLNKFLLVSYPSKQIFPGYQIPGNNFWIWMSLRMGNRIRR